MSYFRLILRRFGEDAAQREAILEGVGVSAEELDDPRTEINFIQQMRQLDNMNRLFGEGWVLDAPELWTPAAHGALGVAVVSAPTIAVAAEVLAGYVSVRTPHQRLKLIRQPNAIILRHGPALRLSESLHRSTAEVVLLAVGAMLGWSLGSARSELRFDYMWAEPAYGPKLQKALAGKVRWRAGANAVIIPKHLLDAPSPLADRVLYQSALERLQEDKRSLSASDGVKGRAERLLAYSDTGRVSSSAAARALGLSQRTLARRLADAGLNHRDLVDSELKARARRWLDDGVLSRAEISERLGFADASGFNRACRRWFKADA